MNLGLKICDLGFGINYELPITNHESPKPLFKRRRFFSTYI